MPYAGGVYTVPPGTEATTLTPIDSSDYNAFVDDIEAAQNAARPVVAGGTGATTAIGGHDALVTKGTDVASAATLNLDAATGMFVDITGTTTVTAITLTTGRTRLARAVGVFQLTASASLIVNGSASVNATTVAGDLLIFEGYASSIVRVWILPTISSALTALGALADPNADRVLFWDDSAGAYAYLTLSPNLVISGTELRSYELWGGAVSDETTAITTGTAKLSFSIPYNFAVVGVYATLNTASSSGTPTFDINEGGTTILSTKIVIDANELTGGSSGYQGTASGAAVISDAAIAAFAQVTIDIDVAGTGAKGAKVFMIGYRTT